MTKIDIKGDFENHWKKANYKNVSKQKLKVASEFMAPAIGYIKDHEGVTTILDAGCGDGVHAEALRISGAKDFLYFGLDISEEAIDLCKKKFGSDDRFSFQYGDLNNEIETVDADIIISYGVVAYTLQPDHTIMNLAKGLKSRGLFLLWIYTPNGIERLSLYGLRSIAKLVGRRGTDLLATLIVYFMKFLPVRSGVNLSNSTFEQCKETVLVNLAPSFLALPSEYEVNNWCEKAGLRKISNNNGNLVWTKE